MGVLSNRIGNVAKFAWSIRSFVIFALAFGAVDAFFAGQVTNGLQEPAFANLAGSEVVDVVLKFVHLGDASDFGLVELAYLTLLVVGLEDLGIFHDTFGCI